MTTGNEQHVFNPKPLDDNWTKWFVGTWEGTGESTAGQGCGVLRVELDLSGQFLICRGEARITSMTEEQRDYMKRNMNASDEEIDRFVATGYQSLELYTIEPQTGDVIAYLFDNLRCTATGMGRREGDKETVDWTWMNGRKGTRVTERIGPDKVLVIERTPMPDGSVMEDRGEMTRAKPSIAHP